MSGVSSADPYRVALLATGTELVDGRCVDTNSPWVEARLRELGWRVVECRHVGDDPQAIGDALAQMVGGAPVLLVSGGLGPTEDDRTREALAGLMQEPLVEDAGAWQDLQAKFASWGRSVSPSNRRQALRPQSARCLANPLGTAPGLVMTAQHTTVYAVPGVPRELRDMVQQHVLPDLKARSGERAWCQRKFQVVGLGESLVGERLAAWMVEGARPEICLTAHVGTLTVTLWDLAEDGGAARLAARAEEVLAALGNHCFAEGERTLAECLVEGLVRQGRTVAVAESCTGGRVAAALTAVPGSSAVFLEGCVTYSNEAKTRTLQVAAQSLAVPGAVSEEVARAMAEGVRQRTGADLAVATTGIAGPSGGTLEKPVGTVWFAVSDAQGTTSLLRQVPGDRQQIQERATSVALDLLRRRLASGAPGASAPSK